MKLKSLNLHFVKNDSNITTCKVGIFSPCLRGFLWVFWFPPTVWLKSSTLNCESKCEWLFVPAIDWRPAQGLPRLSPEVSFMLNLCSPKRDVPNTKNSDILVKILHLPQADADNIHFNGKNNAVALLMY